MDKRLLIIIMSELIDSPMYCESTSDLVNKVFTKHRNEYDMDTIVSGLMTMIELKMFVSVSDGKVTNFEKAGIWFDNMPDERNYSIHRYNVIRLRGIFINLQSHLKENDEIDGIKIINDYINNNCKTLYMRS